MKSIEIKLSTIQDVRDFVNLVTASPHDIDLVSGRYVVDGKSIMGIFSLDLLQPITMQIHSDGADDLIGKMKKFIVG